MDDPAYREGFPMGCADAIGGRGGCIFRPPLCEEVDPVPFKRKTRGVILQLPLPPPNPLIAKQSTYLTCVVVLLQGFLWFCGYRYGVRASVESIYNVKNIQFFMVTVSKKSSSRYIFFAVSDCALVLAWSLRRCFVDRTCKARRQPWSGGGPACWTSPLPKHGRSRRQR